MPPRRLPAVDDHLGDAAGGGRDDRGLARHRLEVHDAQWLVDRRAGERGRGGQQRDDVGAGQHLADPHDAVARACAGCSTRPTTSASISGVSGAPAHSTICTSAGSCGDRAQEERQALLPGDPADEDHRGTVRVDAVLAHPVRVLDRRPQLGVDAVVDHVHLGRVDVGVGAQHVVAHRRRDCDHRGRGLVGGPLDARGDGVPAAELLGLPRPQRLERVRADDVRDVVQQRRRGGRAKLAYQVWEWTRSVPAQPSAMARSTPRVLSAPLAVGQLGEVGVRRVPVLVARARRRRAPGSRDRRARRSARTSSATWTPGAAVDLGRVLLAQHVDSHGLNTIPVRGRGRPACETRGWTCIPTERG